MNVEGVNWVRVIAGAVDRSKTPDGVLFEVPETVEWREGFNIKLARRMVLDARHRSYLLRPDGEVANKTIWHDFAKNLYGLTRMWDHEDDWVELAAGPCKTYGAYIHRGPCWLTAAFLASGGRLPAGMSSLLLVTCEAGGETWLGSVGAW